MSYLTQDELFTLGKDGTKVPIAGYTFGKDGIIVPIDGNSYTLGKDATIIPRPGYHIGKNGLIVKDSSNGGSFKTGPRQLGAAGGPPSGPPYNFNKSNMLLMVGGQILVLVLALMIVFFGTPPLSFPANAVRNMLSRQNSKNNPS